MILRLYQAGCEACAACGESIPNLVCVVYTRIRDVKKCCPALLQIRDWVALGLLNTPLARTSAHVWHTRKLNHTWESSRADTTANIVLRFEK